jgi:hypothetical protein
MRRNRLEGSSSIRGAIGLGEMVNTAIELNLLEAGNEYELVRYEVPKQP